MKLKGVISLVRRMSSRTPGSGSWQVRPWRPSRRLCSTTTYCLNWSIACTSDTEIMLLSQLRKKSGNTGRFRKKFRREKEGTRMDEPRIKILIRDGTQEGCRPYRHYCGMMMKWVWRNEEPHQDRHLHMDYGMALLPRPRQAHRSIRMNHLRMASMGFHILHS